MGVDVKEVKDDVKGVGNDVNQVKDDVKGVLTCVNEIKEDYSSMVLKINAMNNTMEKLLSDKSKNSEQNQSKIDNIFQVHKLNFADYEETPEKRNGGRVTKWTSKCKDFAFKSISESDVEDKNGVQNQVTILKEFQEWQNIIKFYGLTTDGNKTYLVTEWAEFGNLREFYTNYKENFDLKLRLRISLEIARGLNFLRSVEVNINYYLIV